MGVWGFHVKDEENLYPCSASNKRNIADHLQKKVEGNACGRESSNSFTRKANDANLKQLVRCTPKCGCEVTMRIGRSWEMWGTFLSQIPYPGGSVLLMGLHFLSCPWDACPSVSAPKNPMLPLHFQFQTLVMVGPAQIRSWPVRFQACWAWQASGFPPFLNVRYAS